MPKKPKKYYLNENQRSTGPFTSEELAQRYRIGQIDGDTFCCPASLFTTLFGSSWTHLRTHFPGFLSRSEQQRRGSNERTTRAIAFDCVECGANLRITLQHSQASYRCPSCNARYKTVEADGDTPVLLVVLASRHRAQASGKTAERQRTVPPEVRVALAAFGFNAEAIFEDVRQAYRDLVKQYHPDMVAHLGPELRKVAERKTKEINSAYQVLETFYAA